MRYGYLLASIAINVSSYLILKSIAGKPNNFGWVLQFSGALILAGLTTLLFTKALQFSPLSMIYPIFCGASIGLLLIFSFVLLGERVSLINVLGVVMIAGGIFMVTR